MEASERIFELEQKVEQHEKKLNLLVVNLDSLYSIVKVMSDSKTAIDKRKIANKLEKK